MHFKIKENKLISGLRAAVIGFAVAAVGLSAFAEPRTQKNGETGTREFTVVIDAGHGGHDFGAIDNGVNEKDVNLSVAKKLAALVSKKIKNVKVVMTRDDDTFISLEQRANIANRNKGDLFISIHTNSVDKSNPNRKNVAGASVYALGPQKDANNLKVAQRENSVIELEDNYHQKYSGFDPSKDESYIIFEMAQKKTLGQSLKFAEKAQRELVSTAGRKDRGVKQAGFWVLWATSMPSVLVELDFICNPEEAKFLGSSAGQEKFAEALYKAVDSYINSLRKPGSDKAQASQPTIINESDGMADAPQEIGQEGVRTLVASSPRSQKTQAPQGQTATTRNNASKNRRRRSDSSRNLSESRSYETESILLKDENQFLAVKEKDPETVKEEPAPTSTDNSKKKKQKKEKQKEKTVKAEKKSAGSNPNQKTFVVKNVGAVATDVAGVKSQDRGDRPTATQRALSELSAGNGRNTGIVQTASAQTMVYKIQLLATDSEKSPDDPAFCGLRPSGMFRENGKYKYTYGSTTNRREIEQKLLEIKSLLPDATIIVRME